MWAGVVTLFPKLFDAWTTQGVASRALTHGALTLEFENPRDHAHDRHRTVDDRPYGGGPGMVLMAEPMLAAIDALASRAPSRARVLHLTPRGRVLDQRRVEALATEPALLFVAGRYEGIDERIVALRVDDEISIGDYVLTGGELPVMVLLDAVVRHLPGTLGNAESVEFESHRAGLLDCPQFTRPEVLHGAGVPSELLGGDHAAIARWRRSMSLEETYERRPDLLSRRELTREERELLNNQLKGRAERGRLEHRRETKHA